MKISEKDFSSELTFKTSRSSGKGGQHVNKTESRVSLFFDVAASSILSDEQKQILKNSTEVQLSKEFVLQLDVEESRSQLKNKKIAIQRFQEILAKVFKPQKKRKPTKPSKSAIRKRLKAKKQHSEKKKNRRFEP